MWWDIDRAEFLQTLMFVNSGRSVKEMIDQSSCFVFKNGYVYTFNGEIGGRAKTVLPVEFTGVVKGMPLITLLNSMTADKISLVEKNGQFRFKGTKGERGGLNLQAEVLLPLDALERPEKGTWKTLPDNFLDAISLVQECAGKDDNKLVTVCIHLHPKWVEASDSKIKFARFKTKIPIETSVLVKRESIKNIVEFGAVKVAETDTWIHFKNHAGAVLSCRRHVEVYPDLTKYTQLEGKRITLPKGLVSGTELAEIFSQDDADDDSVNIFLSPGEVVVRGDGIHGWASRRLKAKYTGPKISFSIGPKLLTEIVQNHSDALITKEYLKIDGGRWTYVVLFKEQKSNGADQR